jgi:metal-dependent hydrolase (beta-lactamase superfamily II)
MTQTRSITPPPNLRRRWFDIAQLKYPDNPSAWIEYIADLAAQYGADQELDAVEEEIITQGWFANSVHRRAQLRAARRPKPPSLKEQALLAIDTAVADGCLSADVSNIVRRALESTND